MLWPLAQLPVKGCAAEKLSGLESHVSPKKMLQTISDCHGSAKPAGSWVGSARVRVRVGYFRPAPYPDPHHGLGVTREQTRSNSTLNTILILHYITKNFSLNLILFFIFSLSLSQLQVLFIGLVLLIRYPGSCLTWLTLGDGQPRVLGFSSSLLMMLKVDRWPTLCSPSISIRLSCTLTDVLQFTYKICYREVVYDEKEAQTCRLGHRWVFLF